MTDDSVGAATRIIEMVHSRLPHHRARKLTGNDLPALILTPVRWVMLMIVFDVTSGDRLRAWHRICPLFAPDDGTFDEAVGDVSRSSLLGLLPQLTWSVANEIETAQSLSQMLTKEVPVIQRQYETPGGYARNAVPDSHDLPDFPEEARAIAIAHVLDGDQPAADRLLGNAEIDMSTLPPLPQDVVEAARGARHERLLRDGLSEYADPNP